MENQSISYIKDQVKNTKIDQYPILIKELKKDNRKGVLAIVLSMERKLEEIKKENLRLSNMKQREEALYLKGINYIAGVDEVGRGPLFGPVVSCAVILPRQSNILYINDSKKLSAKKREQLKEEIQKEAIAIGIGVVDNNEIDKINILNASKKSMVKAIENLSVKPDFVYIDALNLDIDIKNEGIIKGDENVYSIGAASIIAKCYRDDLIKELAKEYPNYHLDSNMGYGTFEHVNAIKEYGITPYHRKSFLTSILEEENLKEKGEEFEEVSCNYLKRKGYKIIYRNYSCNFGELDIICEKDDILVIVEVKGRKANSLIKGVEAVNREKREKIKKATDCYLKEMNKKSMVRFDVIAVNPSGFAYSINHIEDAFR